MQFPGLSEFKLFATLVLKFWEKIEDMQRVKRENDIKREHRDMDQEPTTHRDREYGVKSDEDYK